MYKICILYTTQPTNCTHNAQERCCKKILYLLHTKNIVCSIHTINNEKITHHIAYKNQIHIEQQTKNKGTHGANHVHLTHLAHYVYPAHCTMYIYTIYTKKTIQGMQYIQSMQSTHNTH